MNKVCCEVKNKNYNKDFPGGPVANTPHPQCRFYPWSGNQIPHAATKSLHATMKDPVRVVQIKKIPRAATKTQDSQNTYIHKLNI